MTYQLMMDTQQFRRETRRGYHFTKFYVHSLHTDMLSQLLTYCLMFSNLEIVQEKSKNRSQKLYDFAVVTSKLSAYLLMMSRHVIGVKRNEKGDGHLVNAGML